MSESMDLSASGPAADTASGPAADTASGPAAEPHPAMEKFEQLVEAHRAITEQVKAMASAIKSLSKDMRKLCKKRRKPSGTPSNLTKPIPLSDELCAFLRRDRGTRLSRGQVTSLVNEYANSNGLKDPGNGRVIVLDQPLAALLGLSAGEQVQIFSVPTHLKARGHYLKDADAAASA